MLQVKASIEYVCAGDECEMSELFDVLQEMDRRYFLIQDLRWEFTMLDYGNTDTITEEHAKYIIMCIYFRGPSLFITVRGSLKSGGGVVESNHLR